MEVVRLAHSGMDEGQGEGDSGWGICLWSRVTRIGYRPQTVSGKRSERWNRYAREPSTDGAYECKALVLNPLFVAVFFKTPGGIQTKHSVKKARRV